MDAISTRLDSICPGWRTGEPIDIEATGATAADLVVIGLPLGLRFLANGNYAHFDTLRDPDDKPLMIGTRVSVECSPPRRSKIVSFWRSGLIVLADGGFVSADEVRAL